MAATQVKLNPNNYAKITFAGWQLINSFTSAGAESSLAVTVDGDTDKEYWIYITNKNSSQNVLVRLNNDSGSNYGYQYINNSAGTVTGARGTTGTSLIDGISNTIADTFIVLQCPSGFPKYSTAQYFQYSSGTTVTKAGITGTVYNSTSNITSINFISASGNFTSGTRFTIYTRRA